MININKINHKMNLAVVGSRTFNNYELLEREILKSNLNIGCIVSGGAKGADKLAERFAKKYNLDTNILLPEWDKYGKSAGYRRNKDIIDACDICIAFWDGQSTGTKHTIDLAQEVKKPLIIIYV
jgi:hypothetical protein